MENREKLRSVAGLVGVADVAAYCGGVKPAQVRLWLWRKQNTDDPLPALFPDPVEFADDGSLGGQVNGGSVWRRDDVIAFREALVAHKPRGGRTPARLKANP